MKQPKRMTLAQKKVISGHKLNYHNWEVMEDTAEELVVRYKLGKMVKRLKKGVNLWKDNGGK